jgi:hypothetical protein
LAEHIRLPTPSPETNGEVKLACPICSAAAPRIIRRKKYLSHLEHLILFWRTGKFHPISLDSAKEGGFSYTQDGQGALVSKTSDRAHVLAVNEGI